MRGSATALLRAIVAASILAALSVASTAVAQYAIPTRVIAGGGSQGLSGRDHTLSGTLGQPVTQTMGSGEFQLAGGFWRTPPRAASIFSDGFEGGSP
jgi:hypothetical protein